MRFEIVRASLALVVLVQCTWGTYDGSTPADASAPDAATVTPLVCSNNVPCGAGTTCCIPDQGGGPFCAGPGACGAGTLMACNSSANCGQGQVCCIGPSDAGAQYQLTCVASSQCPTAQVACAGSNDCGGQSCMQSGCRFNLGTCSATTKACNPQ